MPQVKLVAGDTMNYWIKDHRPALLEVLKGLDILLINDTEARMLAGNNNLVQAARGVIALGPRALVVKHGEYGATLFHSSNPKGRKEELRTFRAPALRSKRSSIPPARATALPAVSSAISPRSPSSRPPPGATRCFTAASWAPLPASASAPSACSSSRAPRSTRASTSFARSRTLTEKSISNAEGWAVLAFCMAASTVAILWSWRHGAMLNYGDAVAHLHIARRVFDSRTPRFSQLGSVWLPLPHILLIPFVQNYDWWATGFAGVVPSALAYIASCSGIYRLARRWLNPVAAALALVFFALNPNLLYLETTAMTEPLFLCEMIWIVVWMVEWRAAIDGETRAASFERASSAPRAFSRIAAALVAAIFTRYDGWIIALLAWTGIGFTLFGAPRRASAAPRVPPPSGCPPSPLSLRPSAGLSTTPLPSATGSTSRAGPTPPQAMTSAPPSFPGLAAASRLAQSLGRAAFLPQSR